MNDVQGIIYRLRKDEPVEGIHRDTGHARKTIRKYRDLAKEHGFLERDKSLPSVAELVKVVGPVKRIEQCTSTVEPYKEVVEDYLDRGVGKKVIWRKLREDHGYSGSYSSVKRYCRRLRPKGGVLSGGDKARRGGSDRLCQRGGSAVMGMASCGRCERL